MVDAPSLLLDSITWDGVTFGGRIRVRTFRRGRRVPRRTGAATWTEGQQIVDKEFELEIEYDDQTTRKNLLEGSPERIGKEATLVIKILNAGSGNEGFQFTFINAMLSEDTGEDSVNDHGVYVSRFFARSSDGIASPLTVVTF